MRDETLDDYLERNNLFLCRQLTDEEILNEWLLTSYNPKTYVWADDTDDDLVLHFARAILRKAQEK